MMNLIDIQTWLAINEIDTNKDGCMFNQEFMIIKYIVFFNRIGVHPLYKDVGLPISSISLSKAFP